MALVGYIASEIVFEVDSANTKFNPTKFVEYTIKVRKNGSRPDDQPITIGRRYSEFLELYTKLREGFPDIFSSFAFPKKAMIGNFSPKVISSRQDGFQSLLMLICSHERARESPLFIQFLQGKEYEEVILHLKCLDFKVAAAPVEKIFRLLNKVLTDRHPLVLRTLCLLVACLVESGDSQKSRHYMHLAVARYEGVSDTDSLRYYVPLLQLAVETLQDCDAVILHERLASMKRRGVKVDGCPSLYYAIKPDLY